MHHLNLFRGDAVAAEENVPREAGDGEDPVRRMNAGTLQIVNRLMHVLATAIEFRRVHVDDERLAEASRDGLARAEGHPVVGMHDVELLSRRHPDAASGVGLGPPQQLAAITAD